MWRPWSILRFHEKSPRTFIEWGVRHGRASLECRWRWWVKNIVIWWRKWWSEPRKTSKASKQERYGEILVVGCCWMLLLCWNLYFYALWLATKRQVHVWKVHVWKSLTHTFLFLDRLTTPSLYNDHSNHLLFLVVDRYRSVWSTNTKEWLRGWRTKSLKSKV